MTDQQGAGGLAWPSHDAGPTPPPEHEAAARDEEETRKPLAMWDRVKFLLLLTLLFWFFVWSEMADNPLITFEDSVDDALSAKWWLFALAAVELTRQLHFVVAEHSARYHRFWSDRVFGRFERRAARMNDWNRFRVARVLKILFFLALVSVLLGAILNVSPVTALFELPARAWDVMPFIMQLAFAFFFVIFQFVGLFWFLSRGGVDVYFPDDIKTRFSDVWGQDAVLDRVKENMVFLEAPEKIEEKGGHVPSGILLWGPPGTGKTLMAEAVAGETGKPFVFVDPGAFQAMFMGVGILKVKGLFRKLRKLAVRYGGVIVFFDEADSLGNRGQVSQGGLAGGGAWSAGEDAGCHGVSYLSPTTAWQVHQWHLRDDVANQPRPGIVDRIFFGGMAGGGGGGMGTLQALLTELSGLKKPRGFYNRIVRRTLGMRPKPPPKYRILVMMATNMPQALDEALLRPGRIDRIYKVGYPSKVGRLRTYEGYLAKVKHVLTREQIDRLATITPYATGASIKDLVNEALIQAIRGDRDAITWSDVIKAKHLKSLGPSENVEYIERERHAVAVHEACHAVAAYRVRQHLTIDIATIDKGSDYLGMVASIPLEEQFTQWRTEYESDIVVALASLAGERLFYDGDNSSGVTGDLQSATTVAMLMEGFWGMGRTIGSHAVTKAGRTGALQGRIETGADRNLLDGEFGSRIEAKLAELLHRAEELLADNTVSVLAVAHALETHKTLSGEDVVAVIEGTVGPLVDGRPYHREDFATEALRYHEHAVTAHRRHGRVEAPLPVFTGNGDLTPPMPVVAEKDTADPE